MPIKIYLDQSTVSMLADSPAWQETKLGCLIAEGLASKKLLVWPSPVHVLETLLCADYDDHGRLKDTPLLDKRMKIAHTLLCLGEAQRMMPSPEVMVVDDFRQTLNTLVPGAVTADALFRQVVRQNQSTYLGILALLAAYRNLDRPEAMNDTSRNKLSTWLLHSRFAKDPDAWVDRLIEAAEQFRVTAVDVWKDVDALPASSINQEIEQNLAVAHPLGKKAREHLQKNKKMISRAYGAAEIAQSVDVLLATDPVLLLTFDVYRIKENWKQLTSALGSSVSLPQAAVEADEATCAGDLDVMRAVLEATFRAFAADGLMITDVMHHVILGELEMVLSKGEIPEHGLSFDADHAAALTRCQLFMTQDGRLENMARRAARYLDDKMGWKVTIAANERQFADAIERS